MQRVAPAAGLMSKLNASGPVGSAASLPLSSGAGTSTSAASATSPSRGPDRNIPLAGNAGLEHAASSSSTLQASLPAAAQRKRLRKGAAG